MTQGTRRPRPAEPADEAPVAVLRKVLLLEEQRGYDDRAVVGGLGALVERLVVKRQLGAEALRLIQDYAQQPPASREASVAALVQALDRMALTGPGARGAPGATPARRAPGRAAPGLTPETPVSALAGVGAARAKRLATLGLTTAGDLRFHFPHRYVDYPAPQPASELGFQHLASFEGRVTRVDLAPLPSRRTRITAVLADETGTVAAVWIRAGAASPFVRVGMRLAVSGPFVRYGRQAFFENPEYEPADDRPLNTRRTVPVYPLTAGISQPAMRAIVRRAVEGLPPLEETLPSSLIDQEQLASRDAAVRMLHWPSSASQLEAARQRLAFDEMLPLQLFVLQRRRAYRTQATAIPIPWGLLADFRRGLAFGLTGAQQRVLSVILEDISRPEPMVRLLQGEVGSGKTVVAAMALLTAVAAGGQAALMAPTEILAEQHFHTLEALYASSMDAIQTTLGRRLRIARLTGALPRTQREQRLAEIAAGEIDLIVGTHAVIQGDVDFPSLTLAVVDEQHRFGVRQRVALRRKGSNPHLLVMTATPIPRTLTLTLYGDLDVSLIDELPPGRMPVATRLVPVARRAEAYEQVKREVAAGHQAFIICPLVEGSETTEARAATTEYERLRHGELADLRLALLHGRMRSSDKDRVMASFAAGEYDVLVATSVVEVGIDVPNATVMVVEGAERFGLAQLHQFRGRVGRGRAPGSCFLIAATEAPESLQRLDVVAGSSNGLELAEEDLRTRGPGEFFGLRQSGFPPLRVGRLSDLAFIEHVRRVADALLQADPGLDRAEHRHLAAAVRSFADDGGEAN